MTTQASPRRYLAIWLPMLAEDCWRHADPAAPADLPVGFVERQGNAMRLTAFSRAALALGFQPGATLADARARVPELVALDRDHDAEARLIARVVAGCGRYTPMAAPTPPDGAVLDMTGCAHLYGGERGLMADLARRLAAAGVTACLGRGTTPEAARARAKFAARDMHDLRELPVAALEASPEVETALRRAGLKTIGDLAARPRAMLAARFGDLALCLARLLEEEDRRITPHRPPAPVHALRRFAEPIGRVEDALACLAELVVQTATVLAHRHQGGRRFEARFFRSDGLVAPLAIETGQPTRDADLVMRLFRERLDALADPIDPGFGFDLIRLDISAAEPLDPHQDGLGRATRPRESLDALVDRLATRLGVSRLHRAAPCDTHIPECAATAAAPAATILWPVPEREEPPLRPLRLFDPPQPVGVTYGLPAGPPKRFTWSGRLHTVARWEGPERIAAEWWRRRDRGGLTRDYYRVEDAHGHRFWLFRHGLHEREVMEPAWYLHGLYA